MQYCQIRIFLGLQWRKNFEQMLLSKVWVRQSLRVYSWNDAFKLSLSSPFFGPDQRLFVLGPELIPKAVIPLDFPRDGKKRNLNKKLGRGTWMCRSCVIAVRHVEPKEGKGV